MKIFSAILLSLLLLLSLKIRAQSVSISSNGGTITDFFSADGNTININDGTFGTVIKHIGRDVDGVTRPMRYVSYKYENGLIVTRQYDGTVSIVYDGTINIDDDIDLTGLFDACVIINAHSGDIMINGDITTNTGFPGKGGSIIMNASAGSIVNNQTLNSNDGNIIIGALSAVNGGVMTCNNQAIFVEYDECSSDGFTNSGSIDAGTGVVVTPLALGSITGETVANAGFNVMGITDVAAQLEQTLNITNLTDTEFALDGGSDMTIPGSGEISTDGSTIFIVTEKCVSIDVGLDFTLTRDLVVVTPGSILTKDEINAQGQSIKMYAGSIDVGELDVGNEGEVGLYAHTLIRTSNIDASGSSNNPNIARITALSLRDIESLFDDSTSEEIEVGGLGSSILFVASNDLASIPEDASDAIEASSPNTMISYISFGDLSLINSQIDGNDSSSVRGTKNLLLGRNKVEVLDGEDDYEVNDNGYITVITSGSVTFVIDGIGGDDGSAFTVIAKENFTMQIDDTYDFDEGNIFLCAGGCIKTQNQSPDIHIENGVFTAIASKDIRIISDSLINGNDSINEGALLQFFSGDEIAISDFDVDGMPDGTIFFSPAINIISSASTQEVKYPVNISGREYSGFTISVNPGGYDIEPNTGIISIPSSASNGDLLVVMHTDDEAYNYTTNIVVNIENATPQIYSNSPMQTVITNGGTVTDLFSADGNTINVIDGSFGPVCKHVGNDVDGTLRPIRYTTYAYDNGLTLSRQFDGSVLIDHMDGDLIIDADFDLSAMPEANFTINVHNGNLIINGNITTNTSINKKGGNININVTNGQLENNGILDANNGNIVIGAKKVVNPGSIMNDDQSIFIATDQSISGSLNNPGTISAGANGYVLSTIDNGSITGNFISSDGTFNVDGITDAATDPANVLTITHLDDTQFEINGGGLMAIPGAGEVSTNGTTISIRTGKAVEFNTGGSIILTRNLEIITPRSVRSLDDVDFTSNTVEIFADLIDVKELDTDNNGGHIKLYARKSIEYEALSVTGNDTDLGGFIHAFALQTVESYTLVSGNRNVDMNGMNSSVNFAAGKNIYLITEDALEGVDVDGENTLGSFIAFDNLIILDANLDFNSSSSRRGSSITMLGRNLNQHLDSRDELDIEDNGYLLYLTSGDINIGGYGLDGDEKSAATLLTPGYFSMDNDDDITMEEGEFFIKAASDIKLQTTDSNVEIEEGNFTAIAGGKIIIIGDEDIDFESGGVAGRVILKSGENIVISNFDSGNTGEVPDFRPTLITTCLPGPHKVPFPIEINVREFDNFMIDSAPPGYYIDPETGSIVIPSSASTGDEISISWEDDEGNTYDSMVFRVSIAPSPPPTSPIPTIGSWALFILGLLLSIIGISWISKNESLIYNP